MSLLDASVELLGKLDVGQDSADLLGKFEAQATAELLGKAEVTHSVDLLGKFDVGQNSAELLGKFEAQATAELLGKAVIRHSTSEELLGKFRMSTDDWIIQGASVEAYIALTIVI